MEQEKKTTISILSPLQVFILTTLLTPYPLYKHIHETKYRKNKKTIYIPDAKITSNNVTYRQIVASYRTNIKA